MHIRVLPSKIVLKTASEELNALFAAQQGKEFLFVISGGSSLGLLEHIDPQHFGPQSTLCVLDERYSADPAVNTMALIQHTAFFTRAQERVTHVIDTTVQQGESIESIATRFEGALREWVTRTRGTIIASIGIGQDAHVGGMMPFPEDESTFNTLFNDQSHWVASYDAHNKNPFRLRITTTLPFLRKVDYAVVYATGESKKQPLERLLAEKGTLYESPCRIVREIKNVELFTDQQI